MEVFFKDVVDDMIDKTKGVWPNNSANIVGWLVGATGAMVDRGSYDARKTERQNKPRWDDAPEYANWMAQDSEECDGHWHWFKNKPEITGNQFGIGTMPTDYDCAGFGEVIGDWRDTLEQRAFDAIKFEPTPACVSVMPDGSVSVGFVCKSGEIKEFSTTMDTQQYNFISSIFDDKNELADWYDYDKQEQVKPVPVGAHCLVSNCNGSFSFCTVRYYGSQLCVVDHDDEYLDQHYHLSSVKFKPLNWNQSHKDRAIGKALAVGVTAEPQSKRDIMERLYDAKMLVIPEK